MSECFAVLHFTLPDLRGKQNPKAKEEEENGRLQAAAYRIPDQRAEGEQRKRLMSQREDSVTVDA
jgi:hypothetical protein